MIPAIQELNFPKIDGKQYATLSHATVNLADMGEKTISTQVKIDGDIVPDFSQDWEVAFQGEKYIMPLRQPQGAKENTSLNSTIDLTFQHWAIYQLKRWMFFTVQPVETGTAVADKYIADVILNLGDLCNLFGQVLRHYYSDTITIDLNPDWDYKQEAVPVSINHSYIWDVLIKLYELFAVRWSIEPNGDSSHYVIKVGYPAEELDHIFEYGFEGGLLKVERQVQSEDIRNMLLGRGGEKNIPKYYFKKSPDEKKWRSDPDWIEELANIYFTNLMGATFRSYVQGWKAAHISKYPGYAAVGESNAYAPWAYRKGYTDSKFDPVEYVKDDESIAKYGPLLGGLDNNEEIYPSIQGSGMDIAVDVEQIESDDVEEATDNDATLSNVGSARGTARNVAKSAYKTLTIRGANFTVPTGKTANFIDDAKILSVVIPGSGGGRGTHSRPQDIATSAELTSKTINIYNAVTGAKKSASGIPAGSWYYEIVAEVHNLTTDKTLNITVGTESPKLQDATLGNDSWKNTFDIWVKNIWETSKLSTETNEEYAERVWKPILGDREQNTAKVMFTTGALAISEDYEFTIVDFPKLDTSKSFGGESSHWRIKLAKSDADLESTGLYVPSTQRQGKAGDKFVFIGTEMTHHYVVWAETALDDWKKDQLREKKDIKPTWVVTTDRVRLNNEGKANALIQKLRIGNSLRLADKRFIQPIEDRAYETLYLQSLTYTYREPSSDDAALNPDVAIVLSNEYATTANPVATMQGEISALQRQVGSISNVEQIVRAIGDKLYLRKDGISDRSLSPTQFFSLLTSGDFRAGLIGGAGWGFFKDENGNWVLEADRVNVRQEMQVNTLVINQAEGRGGMEIDTAAFMEVTRVVETSDGYVCYFDQKEGTVANLFHIDDIAYCNRWTPENTELKFYKRRVISVGVDNITLSKTDVNGSGIPSEKDNIIHFGNYTDKTRQYVKVRDVVGGGYERYIEELSSVNATGVEYYFVGRQDGQQPRWFIGNKDLIPYSGKGDGSYIEYINRRFNLNNVTLSANTTIGDKTLGDLLDGYDASDYLRKALPQNTDIIGGVMLSTMLSLGYNDEAGLRHTLAGMNGAWIDDKGGRTIAAWYGGDMIDAFDYRDTLTGIITLPPDIRAATSLFRMDGTGYLSKGSLWWDDVGNLFLGSGITVSGDGYNATLASILNAFNGLNALLVPIDEEGQELDWKNAVDAVALKARKNFCTEGELSVLGWQSGNEPGVGLVAALSDLTDVKLTGLTAGDLIRWDGKNWVNVKASELGIGGSVDLSKYVTLDTAQEIKGSKTFAAALQVQSLRFERDNEINVTSGRIVIGYRDTPGGVNLCYNNAPLTYGSAAYKILHTGDIILAPNATFGSYVTAIKRGIAVRFGDENTYGAMRKHDAALDVGNGSYARFFRLMHNREDGNLRFQGSTNADSDTTATWGTERTLLDTVNYTSTLDGRYVTIDTTQTIGGAKTFTSDIACSRTGVAAQVVVGRDGRRVSLHSDSNRGVYDNTGDGWLLGTNGSVSFLMRGNYGINILNPLDRLHVHEDCIRVSYAKDNRYVRITPSDFRFVSKSSPGGQADDIGFRKSDDSAYLGIIGGAYAASANTLTYLYYGGTSYTDPAMVILPDKSVVIGATSNTSSAKLQVAGHTYIAGECTILSDRRTKSDIRKLGFRGALTPCSYIKDGKRSIGFIAQDVNELYPELVHKGATPDALWSLNYQAITAVLAAQLNVHEDEITRLHRRVTQLEQELKNYRSA